MKWFIGTVVLAVAVVVAASFSETVVEAVNPDEALLGLLSADTEGVLFVDVAELRRNELVRGWLEERGGVRVPRVVEDFTKHTGMNIETDIDQVMVGWRGEDDALAVVRAAYDPQRVEEYLQDRGVVFESYGGRELYHPNTNEDWRIVFVNGLVLMGRKHSLEQAIDRLGVAASTVLDNPDLLADIQSIEEGHQIWAVGSFGSRLLPDGIAPPMATDLVESLQGGTYQMKLDTGVSGRAVGEFTTPETARRTTDLLRGLVALGKMQSSERQDMVQLLDGVQIDTVASSVEIRFAADGELLKRIGDSGIQVQ